MSIIGPMSSDELRIQLDAMREQLKRERASLRDEFAGKALPALVADYISGTDGFDPDWMISLSRDAYRLADAMLKAREKSV